MNSCLFDQVRLFLKSSFRQNSRLKMLHTHSPTQTSKWLNECRSIHKKCLELYMPSPPHPDTVFSLIAGNCS